MSIERRKVVIVSAPGRSIVAEEDALRSLGVQVQAVWPKDDAELVAQAAGAEVILSLSYNLTGPVLACLPRLVFLPTGAVGMDRVDLAAATENGILVANLATLYVDEVANHAMMLLLTLARRTLQLHQMVADNRWEEAKALFRPTMQVSMPRITGQTLGLAAFGHIARAVAARARGFGMSVIAVDPYVDASVLEAHGVEGVSWDDLFRRSDFVSCHLPLTPETVRAIGETQFRLMKPSAFFINASRGKVVDEGALIEALQQGRIAGAGLDVFAKEPPDPTNPLLTLPNVVLSPHTAWLSDVAVAERPRVVAKQIADVLAGRVPESLVNREVLSRPNLRWRPAQAL